MFLGKILYPITRFKYLIFISFLIVNCEKVEDLDNVVITFGNYLNYKDSFCLEYQCYSKITPKFELGKLRCNFFYDKQEKRYLLMSPTALKHYLYIVKNDTIIWDRKLEYTSMTEADTIGISNFIISWKSGDSVFVPIINDYKKYLIHHVKDLENNLILLGLSNENDTCTQIWHRNIGLIIHEEINDTSNNFPCYRLSKIYSVNGRIKLNIDKLMESLEYFN